MICTVLVVLSVWSDQEGYIGLESYLGENRKDIQTVGWETTLKSDNLKN